MSDKLYSWKNGVSVSIQPTPKISEYDCCFHCIRVNLTHYGFQRKGYTVKVLITEHSKLMGFI